MNRQYYKGQYYLAFYDMNDELVQVFDNQKELMEYLGLERTRQNCQYINLLLYRALKRESQTTYILGSKMKIYIIDVNEDDKEEN